MRVWGGEGGEMCSVAAAEDVVMPSCLHLTSHKSLFSYYGMRRWRGRSESDWRLRMEPTARLVANLLFLALHAVSRPSPPVQLAALAASCELATVFLGGSG